MSYSTTVPIRHPVSVVNSGSLLELKRIIAKPLPNKIVRYDAGDGPDSHVTLQWSKGITPKDDTKRTITPLTNPMCLTKEEVRGQMVEGEIVLPRGQAALQLLPGGVFDGQVLLTAGEFKYLKWEKRKTYGLSVSSNLAKKTNATVEAAPGGGINESAAQSVVKSLTKPANFVGMPNVSSTSQLKRSTFRESMGLNIGASFFYMGISGSNQFAFSSERYRYMYVYSFDQAFLAVSADGISKPQDAFSDATGLGPDALFIREVKYGRRLYVIMESEFDLEKVSNDLSGSLDWGVVSGKLRVQNTSSKVSQYITIRIETQGGNPVSVTNYTKLQEALDGYFASSYGVNDLVPLSYKVTDLNGTPVSLLSKAFLDGKHCLKSSSARLRLKQMVVIKEDDNEPDRSEQIYGSIILRLFNEKGQQVSANGGVMPSGIVPTGVISIASENQPYRLVESKPKIFNPNEQGFYINVKLTSLDMVFNVVPLIKEEDDFGDDTFVTNNKLNKSLRQMLVEGSTSTTFEFRHDASLLALTVEIEPQ